jgi:hypothetical protein
VGLLKMGFAKNQIAENIITDDIASTVKHHLKEAILTDITYDFQ